MRSIRRDRRDRRIAVPVFAALCLAAAVVAGRADDNGKPSGQPALKEVKAEVDAVAALLAEGRPAKAAAALAAVMNRLETIAAGERPPSGLRPLLERCKGLRADLELEGVDVAGIKIPVPQSGTKAASGMKPAANGEQAGGMKKNADEFFGKPPPPAAPRPAAQTVSFSKEVAPLLVRSCGGCHVSGKKGGFQFTSHADLMQTGLVQRGAGEASRLVEVILSGDMPRGGGKVSPDEVGMLVKWINAGATFDGTDPRAPVTALGQAAAGPQPRTSPTKATLVSSLEPGAVSFSMDVAPVLLASCYSCHGGFDDLSANFSMKTFDSLLRGGRSESPIMPGRAAESLLVKKLKGPVGRGQRMPLNRPPLSADQISMIERWINEGARLDGRSTRLDLPTVVAKGRAIKLSHEELLPVRFAAGEHLWSRSLPDEPPHVDGDGDLRVIGNLSPTRAKGFAKTTEDAWKAVQRELANEPSPVKGGVVVYAFDKAIDLSGFWQLRYGRERPQGIVGAGGLVGDVAYAAVLVPAEETGDDAKLLAVEQITAAIVAARETPAWFAEGAGRAIAAKAVPRAPLARAWRQKLPDALVALGSADEFFSDDPAEPDHVRTVAGGFVEDLVGSGRRLRDILSAIDGGKTFEDVFAATFGGPPDRLFVAWVTKAATESRRR
jgi:hypothetical protein